jgi:hypothetical protein
VVEYLYFVKKLPNNSIFLLSVCDCRIYNPRNLLPEDVWYFTNNRKPIRKKSLPIHVGKPFGLRYRVCTMAIAANPHSLLKVSNSRQGGNNGERLTAGAEKVSTRERVKKASTANGWCWSDENIGFQEFFTGFNLNA